MFGRKTCKFCGKKAKNEFFFCPYCGNSFSFADKSTTQHGNVQRNIQGTMANYLDDDLDMNFGFAFNSIFRQLEKQLDKQLRALDKELARGGAQGVSIRIDSTRGTPEIMIKPISQDITGRREVRGNGIRAGKEGTKGEILPKKLSERHLELLQKHINLPREEPKTSIRRLADRIIYEIVLPDVSSIDDIFIRKFQTSIEVKAFAKARNKVYFKVIPLNMEILHYALQDGKLFLELRE